MWRWTCPICGEKIEEDYDEKEIRQYIGATHDCPKCHGLVMIEPDLTCSDFGEELVKRYKDVGLDVIKEDATSSFIAI